MNTEVKEASCQYPLQRTVVRPISFASSSPLQTLSDLPALTLTSHNNFGDRTDPAVTSAHPAHYSEDEAAFLHGYTNVARLDHHSYKQAVPLSALGTTPAPVDCPACGLRGLTVMKYRAGGATHAWALGIGLTTVIFAPCPYMFHHTKDAVHCCGRCGVKLARWHRSGRTEVVAYA